MSGHVQQPSSLIICNASYLGQDHDLLVRDGIIQAFGPSGSFSPPAETRQIMAEGFLLFPSFIDAHVHLRDPGFEYKEDIASGLTAAAHGGFGAVLAMANTAPVNDNAAVSTYMLQEARKHHPHGPALFPIGALTVGLQGTELAPMGELAKAGCVAFSNDGLPVKNTELFRRALEYAKQFDKLVIDHCEDPFLALGSHMNEGLLSGRLGIKGQPTVAEALHVARDILLAEYLKLPIHLAHISCKQSVELIAFAKGRGIEITAETCPHYLFLDESALGHYDANAKVNPPLRTPEDAAAVRDAVLSGLIDCFVSDHAPHAPHEKERPLDQAPSGIIGLETAVALSYALVRDKQLSEERFIQMWHDHPKKLFNLSFPALAPGQAACFFLFDPNQEWVVDSTTIHSKSRNTPFWGKKIRGKVTAHFLSGYQVS